MKLTVWHQSSWNNSFSRFIKTDKVVTKQEVSKSNEITDPVVMQFCTSLILNYMEKLNRVDIRNWTCKMIVEYLLKGDEELCFSNYARQHIDRLIDKHQAILPFSFLHLVE